MDDSPSILQRLIALEAAVFGAAEPAPEVQTEEPPSDAVALKDFIMELLGVLEERTEPLTLTSLENLIWALAENYDVFDDDVDDTPLETSERMFREWFRDHSPLFDEVVPDPDRGFDQDAGDQLEDVEDGGSVGPQQVLSEPDGL